MKKFARLICFALIATVGGLSFAKPLPAQTAGKESFEVSGIKAVRPNLVNAINAVKKGYIAGAKAAFEAYDIAWNGIEVYVSTRDRAMYGDIEQNWQAKITKELNTPGTDNAAIASDLQMMLARFDDAIAMAQKGAPLSPLYDDVARLRTVRSPLRIVTPSLRTGDFAKARKTYSAFDEKWDSIEDLIKARNADSYTIIEKDMIQIERALMPEKPDVDQTSNLVKEVMDKYNAVVADITKDARAAK